MCRVAASLCSFLSDFSLSLSLTLLFACVVGGLSFFLSLSWGVLVFEQSGHGRGRTDGFEEVEVVTSHEALGHGDDGLLKTRLPMVVGADFRDVARQLRHFDLLLLHVLLDAAKQNLPLTRLPPVHLQRTHDKRWAETDGQRRKTGKRQV